MRVLVLYKPNSEHGRMVEEYVRDYKQAGHNGKIQLINVNTRDGSNTAVLYDVMEYPTILVTRIDGSIIRSWSGSTLPLQSDVASYVYA